jgi:hypothetical protein
VQAAQGQEGGAEQSELQAYAEGPAPGGAQVAKLWLRHTPDWDETRYEALAGRRWRFDAPAVSAGAVQGALVVRGSGEEAAAFGVEARALAGWNLGRGAYAGAEAGVQIFAEGAEPRLEATVGHAADRRLTYLQLRYDGDAEGRGYARAEAALVLFTAGGVGVQIGARAGLEHDERAVTIGLWRSASPR